MRPASFTVSLRARDQTSGLGKAQVAIRKGSPRAAVAFARTLSVRLTARPRFARVRDRAGNWSKWKALDVESASR